MREHFEGIGRALDEDERELLAIAGAQDAGEKISRSLDWSDAWLGDYRRKLEEHPGFAALEEERALHKADLHSRWRERHGR